MLQELSLPGLDQLSADGLALFIDRTERPLQGLAGLCDWRLCGQLSRVLDTGFFQGIGGETLLMPSDGRLPVARLLVFGLGNMDSISPEPQLVRALEVCHRAGLRSVALSIDFLSADPQIAADAWLRASRRSPLQKQVLLGDWRAHGKTIRAAIAKAPDFAVSGVGAGEPLPVAQKRA